jgi:uncharacterized protein involved in exopolysaccharide biosynthesis
VMENNQQSPAHPVYTNDEIDLRELFGIVWAEKKLIVAITGVAAVLSVILALLMTEIYTAEAVLAPVEVENSSSMISQLGNAAALLGVNASDSSGDAINIVIATLRSGQFIGRFIEQKQLLMPLFAST